MKTLAFVAVGLAAWLVMGLVMGAAAAYESRPAVRDFMQQMREQHGFEQTELERWFARVTRQTAALEAIARPAEALPWHQYRDIFLTDKRVEQGIAFRRAHRATLARAQADFGVPAEVITAIIGIETFYGANQGRHPVFATLVTLAFDYPPRAGFFRRELEQYLLLAREENFDIFAPKGSYAAAMGEPQFISSSYRSYAIDFDGDGKRDLTNSTADAIGSVANYLKQHGWREGAAVAAAAVYRGGDFPRFAMKPQHTIEQLLGFGLAPMQPLPPSVLAAPMALQLAGGHEYWLGLHNFYIITRYNHSNLYAMAVYQLSRRIGPG